MERRYSMSSSTFVVFVFLTLSLLVFGAESYQCQRERRYDNAEFFSCPGPQDPSNAIYCCGNKLTRYCCSTPSFGDDDTIGKRTLDDDHDDLEGSGYDQNEIIPDLSDSIAERSTIVAGLAKLVGIIIGVAIFVIIVCVICCCCCPFCLFAKKRSQGQVIRTNSQMTQPPVAAGAAYTIPPDQFNQQQMLNPQQQYVPYPTQAPSPMGYQPNPGMAYPPGGMAYPPAGAVYPPGGVGYPPNVGVGYPAGANPPPYPGLADSQPTDYQPTVEKAGYQTQPAYNPNF